jgi:hypothetical protein
MANFNLNNFMTELHRSGIAKSNRFEIQITPPSTLQGFASDGKLVSLYCDITNLPGMSISTKGLKLYGPAYQRPISSEFNGEAINMTFYLDEKMNVKAFFDAWMFKTVNPNSFNVSYAKDYVSQIKISQLAPKAATVNGLTFGNDVVIQDEETYSVYLEDAFPRAMSMVDLSASSVNQAGKLNMTFAYRRWFSDHPSYRGSRAKTNFNPLLEDPMTNRLINPNSVSIRPTTINGNGNGNSNRPFRMEINGTNSSSKQ